MCERKRWSSTILLQRKKVSRNMGDEKKQVRKSFPACVVKIKCIKPVRDASSCVKKWNWVIIQAYVYNKLTRVSLSLRNPSLAYWSYRSPFLYLFCRSYSSSWLAPVPYPRSHLPWWHPSPLNHKVFFFFCFLTIKNTTLGHLTR